MSVGLTEEHGAKAPKGWRQRLGHAMEHHYAHAAILCLIFLDVGAVLCEVMIRNVCVALGNKGTPEDLEALHRAAGDEEPLIREHASWAIARITGRDAADHQPRLSTESR
jgi:HEAT repeat protein